MSEHPSVRFRVAKHGARGPLWSVEVDGEIIHEASYDPEHFTARWLEERGHTGTFLTHLGDSPMPCVVVDIARAAKRAVYEMASGRMANTRWQPFGGRDEQE